jgi:hypothetical protein
MSLENDHEHRIKLRTKSSPSVRVKPKRTTSPTPHTATDRMQVHLERTGEGVKHSFISKLFTLYVTSGFRVGAASAGNVV